MTGPAVLPSARRYAELVLAGGTNDEPEVEEAGARMIDAVDREIEEEGRMTPGRPDIAFQRRDLEQKRSQVAGPDQDRRQARLPRFV